MSKTQLKLVGNHAFIFRKFLNLRDPQLPSPLLGQYGPKAIQLQFFIVPISLPSFYKINSELRPELSPKRIFEIQYP